MSKFSVVTLFGLTIISALHSSFAVKELNQYNETSTLFGDLDELMGTKSQEIFVQNSNNGSASSQGASAAAAALKQYVATQGYYRNNIAFRTSILRRIDTYFGLFYGHGIALHDIPGSKTIQEFRLQMEYPPDADE